MELNQSWEAVQLLSHSKNSQHSVHSEYSLSWLQEPATGFPTLSQMNPVYTHVPSSLRTILILSCNLCLGFSNDLFPSGFPTKMWYLSLQNINTFKFHKIQISLMLFLKTTVRNNVFCPRFYCVLLTTCFSPDRWLLCMSP
jgi:hypothetical protein